MKYMMLTLFILSSFLIAKAASVDTIAIFSNAMHKSIRCVVVTPDSYKDKEQHYPVVYILHGYSGNYADYVKKIPAVVAMADVYQEILVFPDGGFSSWYLDSPVDSAMRFETYVGKEIPAWIDQHYRTKAAPVPCYYWLKYGWTWRFVPGYPSSGNFWCCWQYEWGSGFQAFSQ